MTLSITDGWLYTILGNYSMCLLADAHPAVPSFNGPLPPPSPPSLETALCRHVAQPVTPRSSPPASSSTHPASPPPPQSSRSSAPHAAARSPAANPAPGHKTLAMRLPEERLPQGTAPFGQLQARRRSVLRAVNDCGAVLKVCNVCRNADSARISSPTHT